jgi:pSer/pThr/pTyr-binding forkhead associated (FHA) protein/flagellar biosynthesis/type III secretory pathway chaperone
MGLFKKTSEPTNDGTFERICYLRLPALEGAPTYELVDSLTFGREAGDVIIEDDVIAPNHCTFSIKEGVISLVDHQSEHGTFINDKKISGGKVYLLDEKDKLRLGDLDIEIFYKNGAPILEVDESAAPPEVPPEAQHDKTAEIDPELLKDFKKDLSIKENEDITRDIETKNFHLIDDTETNIPNGSSFARIMGIFIEFLIVYIIFNLIGIFEDFNQLLNSLLTVVKAETVSLYSSYLAADVATLMSSVPALENIKNEVLEIITDIDLVLRTLILFYFVRILSTLLFGLSLGQILCGLKTQGNIVWTRVGGVIREVIGILTGPMLVFDLTTLFSLPSLKELITFTRVKRRGYLIGIPMMLISLIVVTALACISPALRGLEMRENINVVNNFQTHERLTQFQTTLPSSKLMHLALPISDVIMLPHFENKIVDGKKRISPYLSFLTDESIKIDLKILSHFSMDKLMHTLQGFPPLDFAGKDNISSFILNISKSNKNFTMVLNAKEYERFVQEVFEKTQIAFNLEITNILDTVKTHGPELARFVDFREALEQIVPIAFNQISVETIGNISFLLFQNTKKPQEVVLIPLTLQGIVYKLSSADAKGVQLAIEELLAAAVWFPKEPSKKIEDNILILEEQSILKSIDVMLSDDVDVATRGASYQYLYSYFFELAVRSLADENKLLQTQIIASCDQILNVLKLTKKQVTEETPAGDVDKIFEEVFEKTSEEDIFDKTWQNINELKEALKQENRSFFSLDQVI